MEPIYPLISSAAKGPLGVCHLPRLWLKILLFACGRLPEGYRHGEGGFDEFTTTNLGLDRDAEHLGRVERVAPELKRRARAAGPSERHCGRCRLCGRGGGRTGDPARGARQLQDEMTLAGSVRTLKPGAWADTSGHETLRAVVDWSYDLLTPTEQALFQQLGVFAGRFTLEAAQVVTRDDRPTTNDDLMSIRDLLESLAAKSLVQVEWEADMTRRYRLLETLRAYAREKLDADMERAKQEMESAPKHERSERLKEYVTLLAPLISVITLAATLGFQGWQFSRTEKDKADAAMDDKWQGTLQSLSEKSGLPPSVVVLRPFLDSPKSASEARDAAVRFLVGTKDTAFFDDLFGATFVPAKWSNLDDVLRLDRALRAKTDPLLAKSWDPVGRKSDESRLSTDEKSQFQYGMIGVSKVSAHISPVVGTRRPKDEPLDSLGRDLKLPSWEEPYRAEIESGLDAVTYAR